MITQQAVKNLLEESNQYFSNVWNEKVTPYLEKKLEEKDTKTLPKLVSLKQKRGVQDG
jgi:hypothetical protein